MTCFARKAFVIAGGILLWGVVSATPALADNTYGFTNPEPLGAEVQGPVSIEGHYDDENPDNRKAVCTISRIDANLKETDVATVGNPAVASPFQFSWDTTKGFDGTWKIAVHFSDDNGVERANPEGLSMTVKVKNAKNPPGVVITSHADGAVVKAKVHVSGTYDNKDALIRPDEIRFDIAHWNAQKNQIDPINADLCGVNKGTGAFGFDWDTLGEKLDNKDLPNDEYTITVKAMAKNHVDVYYKASAKVTLNNDHVKPDVRITSLDGNHVYSGKVKVNLIATDDNSGIDHVVLFVNKQNVRFFKADDELTYEWDTTQAPAKNGLNYVYAVATDGFGNESYCGPGCSNPVNVQNPPNNPLPVMVEITYPKNGDTLTNANNVVIKGKLLNSKNVQRVDFYVGGEWFSDRYWTQFQKSPYECRKWDASTLPSGPYKISMSAWDNLNVLSDVSVDVIIDNDHAHSMIPQDDVRFKHVVLEWPIANNIVSAHETLKARVNPNYDYTYVQFGFEGGGLIGPNLPAGQGDIYTTDWNTTKEPDGPVILMVGVYDGQNGMIGSDKALVTVSNGNFKPDPNDPQSAKGDGSGSPGAMTGILLNGKNLEDLPRTMALEDLKGGPAVITGALEGNLNRLELSLDDGATWQAAETAGSRWSYSFKPVPDEQYDLKLREIQKDGSVLEFAVPKTRFRYAPSAIPQAAAAPAEASSASSGGQGTSPNTGPAVMMKTSNDAATGSGDSETAAVQ